MPQVTSIRTDENANPRWECCLYQDPGENWFASVTRWYAGGGMAKQYTQTFSTPHEALLEAMAIFPLGDIL